MLGYKHCTLLLLTVFERETDIIAPTLSYVFNLQALKEAHAFALTASCIKPMIF